MTEEVAHYGRRLSLHLNVSKDADHHAEGLALFERFKEPAFFRRMAEFKTALGMPTDRIDIYIEEQAPGVDGRCLSRSDHYMKGIFLKPGPWVDEEGPVWTLAHELIHAAVASHMSGWIVAISSFEDDAEGEAVLLGGAVMAAAERGEERLVEILTELLWRRLLP